MQRLQTEFDDVFIYVGDSSKSFQNVIVNVGDISVSIVFGENEKSGTIILFDESNKPFFNLNRGDIDDRSSLV